MIGEMNMTDIKPAVELNQITTTSDCLSNLQHSDESSLNGSQEAAHDVLKESYLVEFDGDNRGE